MTEPLRVLVVDDERALAEVVASYLRREGFEAILAHDGPGAVAAAREAVPDLIVLDVMLPGFDGVEVCRQLRGFTDAYIIMLTARDEEIDKIVGLSVGADAGNQLARRERLDQVVVRAVVGHQDDSPEAEPLTFGAMSLDTVARTVTVDAAPVDLTRTEFDLLAAMAARPRAAFTRRQLLDSVWGDGWYGDEHVVDVHVRHVRKKLGHARPPPPYLRTVRGIGYGMVT